jgi:hypothetical protein
MDAQPWSVIDYLYPLAFEPTGLFLVLHMSSNFDTNLVLVMGPLKNIKTNLVLVLGPLKTFHTKPGLGIKVICKVNLLFHPLIPSFCGIRKARKFY